MKLLPKIITGQLYRLNLDVLCQSAPGSIYDMRFAQIKECFGADNAIGRAKALTTERGIADYEGNFEKPIGHPEVHRLGIFPKLARSPVLPHNVPRHTDPPDSLVYIYRWNRSARKGQRCRVFARGTMNSVGLEFEDGFTMVSSGNALRRA